MSTAKVLRFVSAFAGAALHVLLLGDTGDTDDHAQAAGVARRHPPT
jgi:hypothetical protein